MAARRKIPAKSAFAGEQASSFTPEHKLADSVDVGGNSPISGIERSIKDRKQLLPLAALALGEFSSITECMLSSSYCCQFQIARWDTATVAGRCAKLLRTPQRECRFNLRISEQPTRRLTQRSGKIIVVADIASGCRIQRWAIIAVTSARTLVTALWIPLFQQKVEGDKYVGHLSKYKGVLTWGDFFHVLPVNLRAVDNDESNTV